MNAISTSNPINHLDDILTAQRAAFLRDGPPSLDRRRAGLKKLRAAILAWRNEIEVALNADFGHRSRHETAIMDVVSVVLERISAGLNWDSPEDLDRRMWWH